MSDDIVFCKESKVPTSSIVCCGRVYMIKHKDKRNHQNPVKNYAKLSGFLMYRGTSSVYKRMEDYIIRAYESLDAFCEKMYLELPVTIAWILNILIGIAASLTAIIKSIESLAMRTPYNLGALWGIWEFYWRIMAVCVAYIIAHVAVVCAIQYAKQMKRSIQASLEDVEVVA